MTENAGLTARRAALALWAILLGLVVIFGAFVAVSRATDAPVFCKTCHEMRPYYNAWASGGHAKNAQCVDCHVDPGFAPRLTHKFVALSEVYNHFFGNRLFPLAVSPEVPNDRCARCHETVVVNRKGFSHQLHASKAACQECHVAAGHPVTLAALKRAGVFNPSVVVRRLLFPKAVVNGGKADIPGHVTVVCSRCHDMAKMGCAPCHTPPNEHPKQAAGKDCTLCHAAGARFVFRHPKTAECAQCHSLPRIHPRVAKGQKCSLCHKRPGVSWAFAHPSAAEHSYRDFACTKCHPQSYSRVYCTCHKGNPPTGD